LRRRGITELPPRIGEVLRFHGACPFDGATRRPCVIALWRDIITNKPKAIHRITIDGQKAERMAWGPIAGAAIKLDADDCVEQGLTIGEGIETTLAAWQVGFRPAWAAGNDKGIAGFPVFGGIDGLHIIVDHDASGAGQRAALACSERWTTAGRDVIRIVPDDVGADFNDIIRGTPR
jgi:Toprim domain-containing protein